VPPNRVIASDGALYETIYTPSFLEAGELFKVFLEGFDREIRLGYSMGSPAIYDLDSVGPHFTLLDGYAYLAQPSRNPTLARALHDLGGLVRRGDEESACPVRDPGLAEGPDPPHGKALSGCRLPLARR
jgi:hypothetical protein